MGDKLLRVMEQYCGVELGVEYNMTSRIGSSLFRPMRKPIYIVREEKLEAWTRKGHIIIASDFGWCWARHRS